MEKLIPVIQSGDYILPAPKMTIFQRTLVRQEIDRVLMGQVSPAKFKLLSFILDRTLGWQKSTERISFKHFTNGIVNLTNGTGLSRATVARCLKELNKEGLIFRSGETKIAQTYGLNLTWVNDDKLQVIAQNNTQIKTGGYNSENRSVPKLRPNKKETLKRTFKEKDRGSADASLSLSSRETPIRSRERTKLEETLEAVNKHSAEKLAKREARYRKSDNVNDVQAHWAKAFAENWPDAPKTPWSPKARGLFKHAMKNEAFKDLSPTELIDWAVPDWGLLRETTFHWMNSMPLSPDPEMFMIHIYKFLLAFGDRETLRHKFDVEGSERRKLQMRRRGMTADQAEKKAADIREGRSKIDEMAEEMERERRSLEREKHILERQKRYLAAREASMKSNGMKFPYEKTLSPLPKINYDEEYQ
ncbi:hypothetical protein [Litorimonas haliclonae]|uniref:hypothetical protein n=1 Tax=Litorimonas haliclonae TaxID=2081977 RepID=UPI0039EFFC36